MKLKHYNHSSPPEMFFNKMFCKSAVHLQDKLYRINTEVVMQLD